MGCVPRRSRGNALLAAILVAVLLLYLSAFSLLSPDDEQDVRTQEDLDAIALLQGGKMRILPAGDYKMWRPRSSRHVEEINIDLQQHEGWDYESKHRAGRDNAYQRDLPQSENSEEQEEEEDEEEEEDLQEELGRKVNNKETFIGDFHRILSENKAKLFNDVDRKSQGDDTEEQFLSFNRGQVQHCLTHGVLGYIPSNLHSEVIQVPKVSSYETAIERKQSFGKVFADRAWGTAWDKAYDRLDASGRGATLSWAQEVIATLHLLINDVKQTLGKTRVRILDLPCGDMAWMSRFLVTRDDVDYTGVDIVPALISNHRKAYRSYPWKFRLVDVLEHPLEGKFDIIVNRMMLQHLYYADSLKILKRFSDTNSTLLLSTTFLRIDTNIELDQKENPGRVRKLNLELPPISLTPPLCVVRDGPPDTFEGWDHYIGVWELPLRRLPACKHPQRMTLKGTDKTIFSCVEWSDR